MKVMKAVKAVKAFNPSDFVEIGKNTLLVALAAAVTYLSENISNVDFGTYGPFVVPIVVAVLNTVGKWIKKIKEVEE